MCLRVRVFGGEGRCWQRVDAGELSKARSELQRVTGGFYLNWTVIQSVIRFVLDKPHQQLCRNGKDRFFFQL